MYETISAFQDQRHFSGVVRTRGEDFAGFFALPAKGIFAGFFELLPAKIGKKI